MDFDEAVQGSKKRENYIYHFIQSRRFGGLFPPCSGLWKVSEGKTMRHPPLSPLSVAVTILYNISFSAEFSVVIWVFFKFNIN